MMFNKSEGQFLTSSLACFFNTVGSVTFGPAKRNPWLERSLFQISVIHQKCKFRHTWRWAIEADKPINFCRRNRNITCSHSSSIDVIHFWFKWLSFRIKSKPSKCTMPYISGISEPHPLGYWRSDSITANYNLCGSHNIKLLKKLFWIRTEWLSDSMSMFCKMNYCLQNRTKVAVKTRGGKQEENIAKKQNHKVKIKLCIELDCKLDGT